MWIGETDTRLDDFSRPVHLDDARLLTTPLARVSGEAHAAMTSPGETILHFAKSDIDAQRPTSTATQDPLTALLDSLIRDLDVEVEIGGVPHVLPSLLQGAVRLPWPLPRRYWKALGGILAAVGEADITVRRSALRLSGDGRLKAGRQRAAAALPSTCGSEGAVALVSAIQPT